ncbi:hypothetical protein R1sor_014221 [Riccia sorocarpa]|uniref:Uncharacterized protein n=1 Tax=Riccia sorocarpa TaxID=122646 RepID=A0ABD3HBT2_9MARC
MDPQNCEGHMVRSPWVRTPKLMKVKRLDQSHIEVTFEIASIREEAAREAWQCKESAIAEAREIRNSAFVESKAILNNTRRGLEIGSGHCSCGVLLQESRDTAKEVVGEAWAESSLLMEGAQQETLAANVVADQIVECARVVTAEFQAQAQMTANEILRSARERERSVLERSYMRSTRERDVARKCEDYWKEKALRSSCGLRGELGVSRTARTARGVASELVELFSKKTARFDISTKRAVCEKFWSHPRLNDYHPASTGSAKLDRSVAQSFLGLKEALKKSKEPKETIIRIQSIILLLH